ncbi:hypothetical protein LY78DRAFT_143585 [Colletotrichum sublineola]|nr:hypothetical protein LY78DRAFT_143585 [Colletotrichum sublineola]
MISCVSNTTLVQHRRQARLEAWWNRLACLKDKLRGWRTAGKTRAGGGPGGFTKSVCHEVCEYLYAGYRLDCRAARGRRQTPNNKLIRSISFMDFEIWCFFREGMDLVELVEWRDFEIGTSLNAVIVFIKNIDCLETSVIRSSAMKGRMHWSPRTRLRNTGG